MKTHLCHYCHPVWRKTPTVYFPEMYNLIFMVRRCLTVQWSREISVSNKLVLTGIRYKVYLNWVKLGTINMT